MSWAAKEDQDMDMIDEWIPESAIKLHRLDWWTSLFKQTRVEELDPSKAHWKALFQCIPCWDDCWHPVKSIAVPEDWHLILTQYIGWWRHVEFVAHKVGKQQEQQQPAIPREVWLMKQSVASWFHSQSVAAWMQSFFFFFFLHQFQRVSEWSEFLRAENFRFRVPCEFWFQAAATTTTNSKCFWTRWISLEKYFRFRV